QAVGRQDPRVDEGVLLRLAHLGRRGAGLGICVVQPHPNPVAVVIGHRRRQRGLSQLLGDLLGVVRGGKVAGLDGIQSDGGGSYLYGGPVYGLVVLFIFCLAGILFVVAAFVPLTGAGLVVGAVGVVFIVAGRRVREGIHGRLPRGGVRAVAGVRPLGIGRSPDPGQQIAAQ